MLGLMQDQPLMLSSLVRHAARHHGEAEVVSKLVDGSIHRTNYRELERRARKLATALSGLGIGDGDRVGTLAWNSYRHLEIYFAVQGSKAVCHTINPRLHPEDIAYIVNHAGDKMLMVDLSFAPLVQAVAPLIAGTVSHVVMLCGPGELPDMTLPAGMMLLDYDTLLDGGREDFEWPQFDENSAAVLCYTSGTTGKPKGVLYSHRSTVLHAFAANMADTLALRAVDRIMLIVPMFHVSAWGGPYAAMMSGAAIVMPGRHLDGASVTKLLNDERVTISAGVPTVWMGLLQHLRATGERLTHTNRMLTGGSACPPLLVEVFGREYGISVEQGWGMTEMSPLGTYNKPKPKHLALSLDEQDALRLKQGRCMYGVDMKIVDGQGRELPWDGVAFGDLLVRGPWVVSAYFGDEPGSATDADGWFATGDVGTIDPDGFLTITDRSKDVIKSGGEWISSITLENLAVSHPDVAEAAVISAKHAKWDERPLLLVRAAPDRTIDPASVMRVYDGQVPKWWLPDAVVVVEELPHTATGKLQKTALRAQYGNYLLEHDNIERPL